MLTRCATASLLVLEPGAKFPFKAAGYRGGSDTAIIVHQFGESVAGLRRRIRYAATELQQYGAALETAALIVAPGGARTDRRSTMVTLAELLEAHQTLALIADRGSPLLQHELISLVGTLIEQDHVKQSIALDFDVARMAELRRGTAPLFKRPEPKPVQLHAVAC